MCLGGSTIRGENQKPYNGALDYDYIMWIDSDIIFTPNDLMKLIKHNKDIVSGLYMMDDMKHFATVEQMDDNFFIKNGYYKFLSYEDIKNKKELFSVDYTGFGWILIKFGVFEKLKYPWFKPLFKDFNNGIVEFTMEDVSLCRLLVEIGYKIWIDPTVLVGHEKKIVL